MNELILPITPASLPQGFCPSDYQAMLNGFAANMSVTFPSTFTGIEVSATKPSDTTKAWLQLDAQGRPVRLYYFAQGAWLSLHPDVPGKTIIWTTAIPTLTSFDGGDAGVLSSISGPMWEEVVAMRAKFPVGAGTLDSGTVLAPGDIGGEEKHTLLTAEMPAHSHIWNPSTSTASGNNADPAGGLLSLQSTNPANEKFYNTSTVGGNGATPSVTQAHNNMPPYFTVAFLRRTNRLFYVVN